MRICTCTVRKCSVHTSRRIESCRQAKNNHLNSEKKDLSESRLVVWFNCATSLLLLMISTFKFFTAQFRSKIANNPNFDSTSIHCSVGTARMKTNLLKNNTFFLDSKSKSHTSEGKSDSYVSKGTCEMLR